VIAITTVRDPGAAEVARQALADAGIPVEVRRLGMNPYFATLTGIELEVRVPEERLAEAEQVLALLSEASAEALLGQAALPLDPEAERRIVAAREALPPAEPKSRALGALFGLLVPVLGPIYAGSPGLALASLFIHLPFFYGLLGGPFDFGELAMSSWLIGRIVDVMGTQQALARHSELHDEDPDAPPSPHEETHSSEGQGQGQRETDHAPVS
jgi:hypothetical protein